MNGASAFEMFSLLLAGDSELSGLMVFVAACMDESYQGGKVAAVGGYVNIERNWRKLIREWHRVVAPTCIKAFHMADCEARRGDFELNWTPDYLLEVKKKLFQIMVERCKFGVVVAVSLADYKRLTRGMSKTKAHPYIQDPYYFCLFGAVQVILKLTRKYLPSLPSDQKIHFALDENDQFKGRALRYFPAFRQQWRGREPYGNVGNLGFLADDAPNYAIQAADILVYEGAKRLLHEMTEPSRPWRQSLLTLV